MKRTLYLLFIGCFFSAFINVSRVAAFEDENPGLVGPNADVNFVVMEPKQDKTIKSELTSTLDFGIIPVLLIGNGTFAATISRLNTTGELIYIYLIGFGIPWSDLNIAISPASVNVRSAISKGWAYGFVIHGILYSKEEPPYKYDVSLKY
jgi:hypothetical protein